MNVLRVDFESSDAPARFAESLKNTGFAVLEHHPVSTHLIEQVYQEWTAFFNDNKKHDYYFNKDTQDGFFPTSISETAKGATVKDIKEYFQYYPWGQYPEFMSNQTRELYKQLNQLAATLLNWLETALPEEISKGLYTPLSKMIEGCEQTMLRILHYPHWLAMSHRVLLERLRMKISTSLPYLWVLQAQAFRLKMFMATGTMYPAFRTVLS